MTKPSLEQLQATNDQHMIAGILIEWTKKSSNKELDELANAFKRVFMYINSLELKEYSFETVISNAMNEKNRAIIRARKAEDQLEEIIKKVNKLEKQLKIFT